MDRCVDLIFFYHVGPSICYLVIHVYFAQREKYSLYYCFSFCIDHTKHPFQSIPVQFERPNIMPKNNSREVLPFKNPVSVWNEHLRYKEQITNSNGHGIVCVRVECIHNSTPNWLDDNGWGVFRLVWLSSVYTKSTPFPPMLPCPSFVTYYLCI